MDGINDISSRAADIAASVRLGGASNAVESARRSGKPEQAVSMFEDMLATTLVREMRRGLEDGFFGAGTGADVYEGWLDEHVGKSLARSGALDIAQAVRISINNKSAKE